MSDNGLVFTEADLGGTIDCDFTGWLPVKLGSARAPEQWGVTLIAGLSHEPAVALWGVATWDRMQQPVCCFTAPTTSTARQLQSAASAAFSALPTAPRPWTRGEIAAASAGALLAAVCGAAAIVAAVTGHGGGFAPNPI